MRYYIRGYQDLFTPYKKRSSTLKEKTCITQFGSNHTGFSFIVCTATTLRITISLFTLQRGKKKKSNIFTFIMCSNYSFPVVILPLALLQAPFLLHTELHTPTSQNLQQHIFHKRHSCKAHQPSSSTLWSSKNLHILLFVLTEAKYCLILHHGEESKLLYMLAPFLGRYKKNSIKVTGQHYSAIFTCSGS